MARNEKGSSLLETTWALLLCLIIMMTAVSFIANTMRGTSHNKDKTFAVQKAISMLEELKGIVERKSGGNINLLDGYDDGPNQNPILTTQQGVSDPADIASGNFQTNGDWRYQRQVSVTKIASLQDNSVRLVSVKVYAQETKEGQQSLLAEVTGLIRTIADKYPPTQVYDVYCIANSQVPGWWVYMANLVPFVQNAITDLQARNPGLEFRTHWIRNLGYGRDTEYTPYINNSAASTSDINWVYYYPGAMPTGSAVNFYYVPTLFKGEVNIDGTVTNDYDATSNSVPYTIADQHNHAMRYADEAALQAARVSAGLETEPTWRLLLDDMYLNPQKYQNAIMINLHGELLPFPPVRNYSDAAKDPETAALQNMRVVTHPERLRYDTTGRTQNSTWPHLRLRVYSYLFDPTSASPADKIMPATTPITVLVRGIDATGATVKRIYGGVDADGTAGTDPYNSDNAPSTPWARRQYYTSEYQAGVGTVFRLYNSPLIAPALSVGGTPTNYKGLQTSRRLYGMDYIPSPVVKTVTLLPGPSTQAQEFPHDLTWPDTAGAPVSKNTARWIIDIPDSVLTENRMYTIETRIGDIDLSNSAAWPGQRTNHPPNLSKTYTWYGNDTWAWGDATFDHTPHVPITEQFQYIGDPRHNPYFDQAAWPYDATTNPIGGGYNRYFDNLNAGGSYGNPDETADYAIFSASGAVRNGWSGTGGLYELDVSRMFQALRTTLLRTQSLWTTMTGFSYYYLGIGGEIGYDSANGFDNSIPVSSKPYTGSGGSTRYESTITNDTYSSTAGGIKIVRENVSAPYWWEMNWLGELYPDDLYTTQWHVNGNLPTGSGADKFKLEYRQNISGRMGPGNQRFFQNSNTPTGQPSVRRTSAGGSTAFFDIGSTTSTFHHNSADGTTGTLQADGNEIASAYHFPIPSPVSISRPFNTNINNTGQNPTDFLNSMWYTGTLSATALTTYYNHSDSSVRGSQLLRLRGTVGNDQAYIVVNGLDRTIQNGSAFIGRWSFLTLIHSFLAGGLSNSLPIQQVPRINITYPNDLTDLSEPTAIDVTWNMAWRRWDGNKYTLNYSDSFADTGAVSYAVLYSADSGRTWLYAQDGTPATPGVRPDNGHLTTNQFYNGWDVSGLAQGSYLLMVEAYRDGKSLHYAYHKQKIFIKR